MNIPTGKKIRLHNVIFVPTLDVSLFSTKQHMKYEGCYKHSQHNQCTIAFPTMSFNADIHNEIEFMVKKPVSDHSIPPSFDEATATLYSKNTTTIQFDRPANSTNLQVHITSTLKGKGSTYIPSRSTPQSIGYDLKSAKNNFNPPTWTKGYTARYSHRYPSWPLWPHCPTQRPCP